jgi:hypothetical protein
MATKKAAGPNPAKKTAKRKTPVKKKAAKKTAKKKKAAKPRKWSAKVTATSDALDLQGNIFKSKDPKKIAASLKRSAEKSKRKKSGPFRSAMSMITFYENRAGENLSASQIKVLDRSKEELRKLFGKEK